jgi:alpha-glucuronidase
MSKVKEMVDLKPKATKITDEQLQELQAVVNDNNAIQFRVGALEAQKHELIHQQVGIQSKIVELQNTFSKEYGTFDVDLQDGSINYPEDGKPRN